jgi:hypothetical protein
LTLIVIPVIYSIVVRDKRQRPEVTATIPVERSVS